MALAIESRLLASASVHERVLRTFSQFQRNALSTLEVDGCTCWVGEVEAIKNEGGLVRAGVGERAVLTFAAQHRGKLRRCVGILHAHVASVHGYADVGFPCRGQAVGHLRFRVTDKQGVGRNFGRRLAQNDIYQLGDIGNVHLSVAVDIRKAFVVGRGFAQNDVDQLSDVCDVYLAVVVYVTDVAWIGRDQGHHHESQQCCHAFCFHFVSIIAG